MLAISSQSADFGLKEDSATNESAVKEDGDFGEFTCRWREQNMSGEKINYSVTLRYYVESRRITVRFDGVDAQWRYSEIEGRYGPITRHDLFLGARIKLFGRSLTINAVAGDACSWIDHEAVLLRRQREFLQDKIISVGAMPVVKRDSPQQLSSIGREVAGSVNLRRLFNEVMQLREQLSDLGLSHLAASMPPRPEHSHSHKGKAKGSNKQDSAKGRSSKPETGADKIEKPPAS
jgi:hypothetical protein